MEMGLRNILFLAPVLWMGCATNSPEAAVRDYFAAATPEDSWASISQEAQSLTGWHGYVEGFKPREPMVSVQSVSAMESGDGDNADLEVHALRAGTANPDVLRMRVKRSYLSWKVVNNEVAWRTASDALARADPAEGLALLARIRAVSPNLPAACGAWAKQLLKSHAADAYELAVRCAQDHADDPAATLTLATTARISGHGKEAIEARRILTSLGCPIPWQQGVEEGIASDDPDLTRACAATAPTPTDDPRMVADVRRLALLWAVRMNAATGAELQRTFEAASAGTSVKDELVCLTRFAVAMVRLGAAPTCSGPCMSMTLSFALTPGKPVRIETNFSSSTVLEQYQWLHDDLGDCLELKSSIAAAIAMQSPTPVWPTDEIRALACRDFAAVRVLNRADMVPGDEQCAAEVVAAREAQKAKDEELARERLRAQAAQAAAELDGTVQLGPQVATRIRETHIADYVAAVLSNEDYRAAIGGLCADFFLAMIRPMVDGFVRDGEPSIQARQTGTTKFKSRRLPAGVFEVSIPLVSRRAGERKAMCFNFALAMDSEFETWRNIMCGECKKRSTLSDYTKWKSKSDFVIDPAP